MPSAAEQNLVFGEIAVKNGLLSARQVAECLKDSAISEKGGHGLPELCLRRGYLSPVQVQSLVRARTFLLRHREDVRVAKALLRHRLVDPSPVQECFRRQQQAYYNGALHLPRLLDFLDREGLLPHDQAETVLKADAQAQPLNETPEPQDEIVFSRNCMGEEDELAGPANAFSLNAAPDSCGSFHVHDLLKHLQPPSTEISDFRFPISDCQKRELERADLKIGNRQSAIGNPPTHHSPIPRAFHRFPVRDSYVEFGRDTWLSFLSDETVVSPLVDISLGGLQVQSMQPVQIGEALDIRIHIPGLARKIRSKGKVRWMSALAAVAASYRIGIEFTRLNAKAAACLKRLAKDSF